VKDHVEDDNEVLTEAEEAVNVGLAVLVVPVVEKHHQWNEEEVDTEDDLFQVERGQLTAGLGLESALAEQVEGHRHVQEKRKHEDAEAELVNFKLFL